MAVVGELHVSFVCTGNICRSPMAEKMFAVHLYREGLADRVRVSSAGTDGWHAGQDADARTNATLRRHGYPTGHVAAKFGSHHRDADLLIALDSGHERRLATLGIPSDRRRLLRSFDPNADSLDVPDPYYGDTADFDLVHDQIAAAIPGLLDWVRATLAARNGAATHDLEADAHNGASFQGRGAAPSGDDARTEIADELSTARGADRKSDQSVSYEPVPDGRP